MSGQKTGQKTELASKLIRVKGTPSLSDAIDRAAARHRMRRPDFIRAALGLACTRGLDWGAELPEEDNGVSTN